MELQIYALRVLARLRIDDEVRTDSFPAQFVEPLNFGWIEVGIVNAEIIQPPLELTPVVVSRTGDAETEREVLELSSGPLN